MPHKISISTLNARSIDIINTIRANASAQYQDLVPKIDSYKDIPKVGEILLGYPALANQFQSELLNRIALVSIKSATFNNRFAKFEKGFLNYGETVEEIFVEIAKLRHFDVEKAEEREFKRTLPKMRNIFHAMNYRVQYPITIQESDLRHAFLSADGVTDMITRIINAVYTAVEYDEYLLYKYLLIKAISHGRIHPVNIADGGGGWNGHATVYRAYYNDLQFMRTTYNEQHVLTSTPTDRMYIFMDSFYNAQFDVNVLAGAFNMDKTNFMGKLQLIDDWKTFDNERFSELVEYTDAFEPVTADELELCSHVKAVLIDSDWFQVYTLKAKMTEKYVASGDYTNYFYNIDKIISYSPFASGICFIQQNIENPASITAEITAKDMGENAIVFTLEIEDDTPALTGTTPHFVQTAEATENGIAIHKYGAVIFPTSATTTTLWLDLEGTMYKATTMLTTAATVGTTLVFQKQASSSYSMEKEQDNTKKKGEK